MPKASSKTKKTTVTKKSPSSSKLAIKTRVIHRLPNVWVLSRDCLKPIWKYRYVFIGVVLIYGVVNFVLAQGFSSGLNVSSTKNELSSLFQGRFTGLSSGVTVYALMIASFGGSSSGSGGGFGYSLIFFILGSLAIIWVIRNAFGDVKIRIRDAYYKGMYALVPFVAIMLLIGIELLPMVAGISIYVISVNNGIAVTGIEKFAFILLMLLLSAVTLFFISSSVFALYIVTLPDMTPLKALRSARDLVKKRRLAVIARVIYLPLALLLISAAITVPFIIFAAPAAPWAFMILSLVLLAVAHSYMYNLYRELLK